MIRQSFQFDPDPLWKRNMIITRAVKDSSIAVVDWVDTNGLRHISLFYQDPELCLKECSFDFSVNRWASGRSILAMRPLTELVNLF